MQTSYTCLGEVHTPQDIWPRCAHRTATHLFLLIQKKAAVRDAQQPFLKSCRCWSTRTRTWNDRTRICSVTITPYSNLFKVRTSTRGISLLRCKVTKFSLTANLRLYFFDKIQVCQKKKEEASHESSIPRHRKARLAFLLHHLTTKSWNKAIFLLNLKKLT